MQMTLVSLQINGNMFIRFVHVPPETKACLCIILLDVVIYSLKNRLFKFIAKGV
jgi:hypothetical protein